MNLMARKHLEKKKNLMVSKPTRRRWDDLPEFIIQHIQSFLPATRDGFNSSLVSKTYLRAWSNRPFLRFIDPTATLSPTFSRSSPQWGRIRADFIKALDDTLARYQENGLTLQNFHLDFAFDGDPISEALLLNKWFLAVSRLAGLKEISLDIMQTRIHSYRLDINGEIFFSPKTLETVILSFINLEEPLGAHEIKCSRLRRLELDKVRVGQALLDSLFTGCPLIEEITLRWCRTSNGVVIKVKNLRHLRSFVFFTFDPSHILEIDNTLNLHSFHYVNASKDPNRTLKIDSDPALTCLNISCHDMYPFHGYLSIGYFTLSGDVINLTSDSLKELNLSTSNKEHPAHIQIYAPNLVAFEYEVDYERSTSPPLSFVDDIFSGPCEMRLSTSSPNCLDTSYFHVMREILRRASSGSLVIFYTYDYIEVNIDVQELMMVSHPPRVELKVLQLDFGLTLSPAYDAKIADAFFSICQPRIVGVYNGVTLKESLRKVLMESKSPSCCAAHGHNRCWRHYLKGFKIGFGDTQVDSDDGNITWLPGHEWTENELSYNVFFGLEWLY